MKSFLQFIKAGKESIPSDIVIIPQEEWSEGKDDPTEYSYDKHIIKVRSDYNWKTDPAGWIVHERVHKKLDEQGFKDDGKPYPENAVEHQAYVEQFKSLKQKGTELKTVISLMPQKFDYFPDIMNKYWEEAVIPKYKYRYKNLY